VFERVAGPFSGVAAGPVWDGSNILFSDLTNNVIRRYHPSTRSDDVHVEKTFGANGLAFDPDRRLLVCEGGTPRGGRRIVRHERDGTRTVLGSRYHGRRLNSPNDIVVDRLGRIWFSDPCSGNPMGMDLLHESVYRLDPQAAGAYAITRMTFDTRRPNGLAFSPDERTLYVAESPLPPQPGIELRAYRVQDDGTLGPPRVLHDFGSGRGVDGMAIDRQGNIVATAGWSNGGRGPRIVVFDPDGAILAEHPVPTEPTNCCFAEEGSALYVTAIDGALYRAATDLFGAGFAAPKIGRSHGG
jgi:gluconolactonase